MQAKFIVFVMAKTRACGQTIQCLRISGVCRRRGRRRRNSPRPCDDEGDVVLLGVLQPAILDTFRVTITESSCLSLPRLEHFWNLFILASHVIIGFVIIGFVVVVEFRNLRHVCVVRHALHEMYEIMNCMNSKNLTGCGVRSAGKWEKVDAFLSR